MARLDLKNQYCVNDGKPIYILKNKPEIKIREKELTMPTNEDSGNVPNLPGPSKLVNCERKCKLNDEQFIEDPNRRQENIFLKNEEKSHGVSPNGNLAKDDGKMQESEKVSGIKGIKCHLECVKELNAQEEIEKTTSDVMLARHTQNNFDKEIGGKTKILLSKKPALDNESFPVESKGQESEDFDIGSGTKTGETGFTSRKRKKDSDIILPVENEGAVTQDSVSGQKRKKRKTEQAAGNQAKGDSDTDSSSDSEESELDFGLSNTSDDDDEDSDDNDSLNLFGSGSDSDDAEHTERTVYIFSTEMSQLPAKCMKRKEHRTFRDKILEQKSWVRFEGSPASEMQQPLIKRSLNLLGNGRHGVDNGENMATRKLGSPFPIKLNRLHVQLFDNSPYGAVHRGQFEQEKAGSCSLTNLIRVPIQLFSVSLNRVFSYTSKKPVHFASLRIVVFFTLVCFSQARNPDQCQTNGLHTTKLLNGSNPFCSAGVELTSGDFLLKGTHKATVDRNKRLLLEAEVWVQTFLNIACYLLLASKAICLHKDLPKTMRKVPMIAMTICMITQFFWTSQGNLNEDDDDDNDISSDTHAVDEKITSHRFQLGTFIVGTVLFCCVLWAITEQMIENSRSDTEFNNFVRKDTSPHSCQICGVFPSNDEWFVCVRGKHMAKTHELLECAEIVYESHEVNIGEEPDKLTDEKDVIDINMSKKAFMPSVLEDILFERQVEESTDDTSEDFNESFQMVKGEENDFQDSHFNNIDANTAGVSNFLRTEINRNDSGKPPVAYVAEIEKMDNGQEEVNVLIPQGTPFHFGQSQPLDDNTSYSMPTVGKGTKVSKKKIRMQVIPNQWKQTEELRDVKTVAKNACSYSLDMNSSNDTFFNLKYKVKSEKSSKKKIDCTLKEKDFDRMMLLRRVTWLPINELPVPEIDLTVAHLTNFEPIMEIIDLIAAGTPPTPHISMRYELLRFCTLRSYPKEDKPYLIKLAEAGFYYASDGDGVVCYCCGIRRYNWTAEDNPKKIHERINPSCKFLRKNEEVNVPVQYFGPYSKELMAIMEIPEPIERPQVSEDVNNDWAPERIRTPASQQPNRANESGTNALGINTAIPKHSQYATKTAREASYSTWPDTSSHTPEVLADAGFFYAGFGDCVRCFYCGIGLRHWTAEDDPWIEHARWSKNCVFVKQKKGEEFVNLVQLAVQYSQDNEANPSGQNQLQSQEIERLLLSDAAQSVLEMGYQPRLIKKSIEEILKQNGDTNITAELLMEKVLEIEESENHSQSAPQATATITSSATAAQATATTTTTNTATAVQVKTGTGKPEITKPEESKEATTISKAEKKPGKFDASKENKSKEKKEDKGKEDKDESQEDPKAIKKENEELKEQTLCKVCLDNTVCIVFLPCGHLVTCADCAPAMRKCPICRALVKGTVRTYMS